VEQALREATVPQGPQRKLRVVLAAGPKDHGPDEHDYPLWQSRWAKLLDLAENLEIHQADGWPTPEQLGTADLIVFNSANPQWGKDKAAELDAYLARGGGLVYLHFATNGRDAAETLAERIGLAAHVRSTRYRHGALELTFPAPDHPITRGFTAANGLDRVRFVDESYWNMIGDPARIHVLASAVEEGQPRPLLWTREHGGGRIFVSILGHYTWTFDDPLFRMLVLRGMMWAAGEPADRLANLITVGARVEP
jgi:type 1 glutamine amidotransferase